jgi:hypothetical protein
MLTTRGTISKPNGNDREDIVRVERVAAGVNGPEVVEIVSVTRNGEDVTAEARENHAKKLEKEESKARAGVASKANEEDVDGFSLTLPTGKDEERFAFSPLPTGDGTCGASFAPGREHAKEAGLAVGELHWDCETLDPLWVTGRPAKNPRWVSELAIRMELQRSGEMLFVARTVTRGVGGLLFVKRRFHIVTEVSDLRRTGGSAGDAGSF